MKRKLIAALAVCIMTAVTSFGAGGGVEPGCEGGCYNVYTYSAGNFTFRSQVQNTGGLGGLVILSYETGALLVNGWNNTGVAATMTNSSGCIRGGSIVPCRNENRGIGGEATPYIVAEPIGDMPSMATTNNVSALVLISPATAVAHFNQMPAGIDRNVAGQMIAVRWAMTDPTSAATWVASLPLAEHNFARAGLEVGTQLFLERITH